jgi:alpha-L-fucosidase
VARYRVEGLVEGAWRPLSDGTTIGYRKLDRVEPVTVSRLRVTVDDAVDAVQQLELKAWAPPA